MTEHYSRNTHAAQLWCAKCRRFTMHRIDHGRRGPCLDCIAQLDTTHRQRTPPPQLTLQLPPEKP